MDSTVECTQNCNVDWTLNCNVNCTLNCTWTGCTVQYNEQLLETTTFTGPFQGCKNIKKRNMLIPTFYLIDISGYYYNYIDI